jgi:hypothetical protein
MSLELMQAKFVFDWTMIDFIATKQFFNRILQKQIFLCLFTYSPTPAFVGNIHLT